MVEISSEEMWNDFYEKINTMFIQEKQLRHNNDHNGLADICCKVVSYLPIFTKIWLKLQTAFDQKEFGRLREWLLVLCKRRGQAKKATVDMIELCMKTFLD